MEADYRKPVAFAEGGGMVNYGLYPASDGLTAKEGDWVTFDVNKRLVKAASDPTDLAGILNQDADDCEEDEMLRVIKACPQNIFVMNVRNDGDDDSDDATAQTQVTGEYGLFVDTDGSSYVDLSDTGNTVFSVQDINSEYEVGTVYGTVNVKVLAAKCLFV